MFLEKVEDVTSLKVNIWINKNLGILQLSKTVKKKDYKPETMCNNCDSIEAAIGRCFDCEKYMCNACITAHQRMATLTKDHRLMTLDEIKDKGIPVVEKPPLCGRHKGEVKKVYCKTCEGLICRDCIIIDHKDHDFCFVEDIIDKRKDEIIEIVHKTSETKDKVGNCLKSVLEMQEQVKEKAMNTEVIIHEVINKQINALEAQRTALLQQTRNKTSIEMKKLTAKEDDFTIHMATLTSAIKFTENLLTKGSNIDVMSISVEVMTRLSQLAAMPVNEEMEQVEMPVLEVKEHIIKDRIKRFVKIRSVAYDSDFEVPLQGDSAEPEFADDHETKYPEYPCLGMWLVEPKLGEKKKTAKELIRMNKILKKKACT